MTVSAHMGDALLPRQRLVYILVLGALTALGPLTIDLYLPAFPTIEADFDVSTALVQLTLSATTLGFALGQLVVGPWSDKVGRRLPLIIATTVHILASVGISIAPTIEWLFALRVLQGAGAASAAVVSLAVVRDLFGGLSLVRMLSRLALVTGLAPVLAPLVGSQLLLLFPWRGIFVFLAAYGLLVMVASVLFIVETMPPERRALLPHSTTRERYRALFSDRIFVGTLLIGGMTFSGLFAYLSSSSFLFQNVYGLNPQQFGLLFAVNSLGVVIGVQSSARLMRIIGPQWVLVGTGIALLVSATSIAVVDILSGTLIGVMVPLFFFITACGFSFPAIQALALAFHGSEAGTAASLLGAFNFGLSALVAPLVGVLGIATAVPMALIMASTAVVSIIVMWTVVRPRTVPPLTR